MSEQNTENNKRVYYQEQSNYLAVIHRFAHRLPSLSKIQDLLWYVVEEVIPQLGFEDCVIYLLDSDGITLHQRAVWDKHLKNPNRDLSNFKVVMGEGIAGTAAQTGKIINSADTSTDSRYKIESKINLSECSIPLLYDNKVIGVLDSEHSALNYFTKEREQCLVTVASMLSTSVGKSISMDKVERTIEKLRDAEKLQKALYEISNLFHTAHNMNDFYTKLHEIVGTLLYAVNFGIALYDKQNGSINLPYFIDTVDEPPDEIMSADLLKKTLTFHCLTKNESFFLTRTAIDLLYEEHGFERLGTTPNAWMGEPFILDKNTTGIIIVQSYIDSINYSYQDSELLKFVAQHLNTTLKYMRAKEQIQHQALHDPLTGLPNRSLFNDRLQHRMDSWKRKSDGMFAILFLDLDHFKSINDSLGHHVGDVVLQKVSNYIKNSVRANDTVARFGGDEFAILLETIEVQSEAIDAAERIINAIEREMIINDNSLNLSASIGIRCCTDESDLTELVKNADLAMYQAKHSGRGCYCVYLKDQVVVEQRLDQLNAEIKIAIKEHQFVVHYQPIVSLVNESIIGAEALVRWQHPKGGLLFPGDFLEVAEKSGLIIDIDLLVMEIAIMQIKEWDSEQSKMSDLTVNVNLSGRHFNSTDIAFKVEELLKRHQVAGSKLNIELTETTLIESIEIMNNIINQIKQLSVSVVLDDFGTGYSALSYLHQFHIDVLKIDRSFINNMSPNSDEHPIINTIISLADAMSMKTVAEGIEEPFQLQTLMDMGCQFGQGYFFAKPLPTEEFKKLVLQDVKNQQD